MATYKGELLSRYYEGQSRRLSHYAFARIDRFAHLASFAPNLVNAINKTPILSSLIKKILHIHPNRTLPRFHKPFTPSPPLPPPHPLNPHTRATPHAPAATHPRPPLPPDPVRHQTRTPLQPPAARNTRKHPSPRPLPSPGDNGYGRRASPPLRHRRPSPTPRLRLLRHGRPFRLRKRQIRPLPKI